MQPSKVIYLVFCFLIPIRPQTDVGFGTVAGRRKETNMEKQKEWVLGQLLENGYITRNECLKNYISRLGAIICDLKKEGYDFSAGYVKTVYGKDFRYDLISRPQPNERHLFELQPLTN